MAESHGTAKQPIGGTSSHTEAEGGAHPFPPFQTSTLNAPIAVVTMLSARFRSTIGLLPAPALNGFPSYPNIERASRHAVQVPGFDETDASRGGDNCSTTKWCACGSGVGGLA